MSIAEAEAEDMAAILERVARLSLQGRIVLARRILESLDGSKPAAAEVADRSRRHGLTAAELHRQLNMPKPAPDDETVRRWIDEYRMAKYGR